MMVPLLGPRLCKVYQSFWNGIICRVLTKPWTFFYNLNFVRAIFTFWTGAKIVWWLLITSVQCISYGVHFTQLIRFARVSSHVANFNPCNKLLTQKLLKQGYWYHKLRKTFSKFYQQNYDLISNFQVGLKSLLRQGLSEPEFYGDLVYKLKMNVDSYNFSAQFIKIISHYKKFGYNINVLKQTSC